MRNKKIVANEFHLMHKIRISFSPKRNLRKKARKQMEQDLNYLSGGGTKLLKKIRVGTKDRTCN